jgi:hypothetical protein
MSRLDEINASAGYGGLSPAQTASIANGASLSGPIDMGALRPAWLSMPAGWDAAAITFQVSYDAVNYQNFYKDDGTEYSVTVALSRAVKLNIADFLGVRALKLRSGTGAAPVNQTAQRDIPVVLVP